MKNLDASSVKLRKRISLWCYSQAPSDIFCWCLFKRRSDWCRNCPVVNAQQDTKQLSSGSEIETKREGKYIFLKGWSKKKSEREATGGFYLNAGICVRCILCNEMPQFCSLKPPGAAKWPVPAGGLRTGPLSPLTETSSWVMAPIHPPSHASRWEIAPSARTWCHRAVMMPCCFPPFGALENITITLIGHQQKCPLGEGATIFARRLGVAGTRVPPRGNAVI